MPLKFDSPDVEEKYTSNSVSDPVIHLPGKNGTGFRCNLSKINMEQAERIFAEKWYSCGAIHGSE